MNSDDEAAPIVPTPTLAPSLVGTQPPVRDPHPVLLLMPSSLQRVLQRLPRTAPFPLRHLVSRLSTPLEGLFINTSLHSGTIQTWS